jgi:hypothetical protein
MSAFDWNAFVATLIATIVGALVAAFIGLAVARTERPQPFFTVEARPKGGGDMHISDGSTSVAFDVTNVGDGPAYNVVITPTGGSAKPYPARTAKLDPGQSLRSWISVPAYGDYTWNPGTGKYHDSQRMTWPTDPGVRVQWQQPPQRHRVRSHHLRLSDPSAPHPDEPA